MPLVYKVEIQSIDYPNTGWRIWQGYETEDFEEALIEAKTLSYWPPMNRRVISVDTTVVSKVFDDKLAYDVDGRE
jgi:hypothetical protein